MKAWRKGLSEERPLRTTLPGGGAPLLGLVSVLALVAFMAGRWSVSAKASDGELPHPHPSFSGAADTVHGPVWYTCSMHPQVRATDPEARCPICGMELIPVAAESVPDAGAEGQVLLRLSPRAAALLHVETYPVERRVVSRRVRLYGQLEVDETRLRTVAARVAGRIERLEVAFAGQVVRVGDPMVALYSPALIAAQEELLQAFRAYQAGESSSSSFSESSRARLEAARDKLRLLGLSQEEIDAVLERGVVAETVVLPAPLDGVVLAREVEEGAYVETGQPIYRLADLSRLWVYLEVPEREASGLRAGLVVDFQVQAFAGERFPGRVTFVQPTLHLEARTVRVRVDLPNPSGRLKPGMFVTGELELPVEAAPGGKRGEPPLVIPATAPLLTGDRAVVYVQTPGPDGPAFEGREVVLGPRTGDWWVVKEGLREGEWVVSRGNFRIDAELQIRGRPSLMASTGATGSSTPGQGAHQALSPPSPPPSEKPGGSLGGQTPSAFSERLGEVVKANFQLVIRLAGDDPAGARAAAMGALEGISRVESGLLAPSARGSWEALSRRMRSSLEALVAERDFEAMRGHFEVFSDALTEAVRAYGTGSVRPVYRARCPMVKGREAFWLAPTQEITNPYHGSRMFSCGDIVETLVPPGRGGERP